VRGEILDRAGRLCATTTQEGLPRPRRDWSRPSRLHPLAAARLAGSVRPPARPDLLANGLEIRCIRR